MMLKNHVPGLYTCVELMDSGNIAHCTMAKANEIIVVGELSTNLLVQAAMNHGLTRFISELVSNRYGNDLYKIPVPTYLVGQTFFQGLCALKEKEDILCIGVEDQAGENLVSNPDSAYRLGAEDFLIVISRDRPGDLG
jgi:voltage-gated potassium channel